MDKGEIYAFRRGQLITRKSKLVTTPHPRHKDAPEGLTLLVTASGASLFEAVALNGSKVGKTYSRLRHENYEALPPGSMALVKN